VVDKGERAAARRAGSDVTVSRPGGGVGPARNAGLEAVIGRHVLFLDADDELIAGRLADMSSHLDRAPRRVHAVAGSLRRMSDGTVWPATWRAEVACAPGGGPSLLFANALPIVSACLMRASSMPRDGLFPDLEDEDWHAAVKLRSRGRIAFTPTPSAAYRDDAGTSSRRPRDRARLEASHARLLRSGAAHSLMWRAADMMARPVRQRHRDELLARWGEV
jgi:glycosyltransferase involved in cell wall biosynthesis